MQVLKQIQDNPPAWWQGEAVRQRKNLRSSQNDLLHAQQALIAEKVPLCS